MAKLPAEWIFIPKMKDAVTIEIEKKELITCKNCVHWSPGTITDTDDFIPPKCALHGGGWSSGDYCCDAERIQD